MYAGHFGMFMSSSVSSEASGSSASRILSPSQVWVASSIQMPSLIRPALCMRSRPGLMYVRFSWKSGDVVTAGSWNRVAFSPKLRAVVCVRVSPQLTDEATSAVTACEGPATAAPVSAANGVAAVSRMRLLRVIIELLS